MNQEQGNIYGIQLMFQIRERLTDRVLLNENLFLKFPKGPRFITGWMRTGKDNEQPLCYDIKTMIIHHLETNDVHKQQKIGNKLLQSLKGRDWFCVACVLEVTHFEKVTQLQSWYEQNSKSSFDQFLNMDVFK